MTRPSDALSDWLVRVGADDWAWYAKRLSANDTGLTGGHQVGFYVQGDFALTVAPELAEPILNPRRTLRFTLVSHEQHARPNLIYYNSRHIRHQANGRNEFRMTGLGGRGSALQDPESTGSILVTAWDRSNVVEAWLTSNLEQEEIVENALGPVEPATQVMRLASVEGRPAITISAQDVCTPLISDLPGAWSTHFPTGRELTDEAVRRRQGSGAVADRRLVDRYRCEFGLFKVVEAAHLLPLVSGGFATVDEFLTVAQTVTNRRKSRAGRSLELHLACIFDEEGVHYDTGVTTEENRRPDFVFPSISAYRAGRPSLMLGVKTSVKDRWRQVIDEAARIPEKHLFTLSEGVSTDQFSQMEGAGIRLVVPAENKHRFPAAVRSRLLTLAEFLRMVRWSDRVPPGGSPMTRTSTGMPTGLLYRAGDLANGE
jgi:hypothetical protein